MSEELNRFLQDRQASPAQAPPEPLPPATAPQQTQPAQTQPQQTQPAAPAPAPAPADEFSIEGFKQNRRQPMAPQPDQVIDRKSGAPMELRTELGAHSTDLPTQQRVLAAKGYETDVDPETQRIMYRDPNQPGPWTVADPVGPDWGDITQALPEIVGSALSVPAYGGAFALGAGGTAATGVGVPASPLVGHAAGIAAATESYVQGRRGTAAFIRWLMDSPKVEGEGPQDVADALVDNINERAQVAAGEVIGAGTAPYIARGAAAVGRGVQRALGGGRRTPEEMAAIVRTAQEHGIDSLTRGQVTNNAGLQTMEAFGRESPLSAYEMDELYARQAEQVGDAVEGVAGRAAVAPGAGILRRRDDLGDFIKGSIRNRMSEMEAEEDRLFNAAYDLVGEDTPVMLNNVTGLLDELEQAQARAPNSLMQYDEAIKRMKGIMSDATIMPGQQSGSIDLNTLRRIRTEIRQKQKDLPIVGQTGQQQAVKRVYDAITDDLNAAVEQAGPDALRAYRAANRYTATVKAPNEQFLAPKLSDTKTPESVADVVMAGRPRASEIKRLRANMSRDDWDTVASSVAGRLGQATPGRQAAGEDTFSPAQFVTDVNRLKRDGAWDEIFGGTRYHGVASELDKLQKVSDAIKSAEKWRNHSGTARHLIIQGLLTGSGMGIGYGVSGEDSGALGIGGGILASLFVPKLAAKYASRFTPGFQRRILQSPRLLRWLRQYGQVSQEKMGAHLGRLMAISEQNAPDSPTALELYEVSRQLNTDTEEAAKAAREYSAQVRGQQPGKPIAPTYKGSALKGLLRMQTTAQGLTEDPEGMGQTLREIEALGQHPGFQRAAEAADAADGVMDGTWAYIKSVFNEPDTLAMLGHQGAEQLAGLGLGILLALPAGKAVKMAGGSKLMQRIVQAGVGIGGASFAQTFGPNMGTYIQEGYNWDQAQARSMIRSIAQGSIDASLGMLLPVRIGNSQIVNIPAQLLLQGGGEVAGEAGGQLAVGDELKRSELIAEGVFGSLFGVPVDVATAFADKVLPKVKDQGAQPGPPTARDRAMFARNRQPPPTGPAAPPPAGPSSPPAGPGAGAAAPPPAAPGPVAPAPGQPPAAPGRVSPPAPPGAAGTAAAPEPAPTPPAPEGGPPAGSPGGAGAAQAEPRVGRQTVAITSDGGRMDTRMELVEADDLIASHDERGAVNQAYPQELQPRDRGRAASQVQITQMSGNLQPEALGDSGNVQTGAPIIGADNVVESGNARSLALRRAYRTGAAQGYRDWLQQNAEQFGLSPDQVSQMTSPVLVRRRTTELDQAGRQAFTRDANLSATQRMAPAEQARADAELLTPEVIQRLDTGDIGGEANNRFVQAFMGQLSTEEASGLVGKNNQVTKPGLDRMQAALVQYAYDNEGLTGLQAETNDESVNMMRALSLAAPTMAKVRAAGDTSMIDIVNDAVELVRNARRNGQSVQEAIGQRDMLEDDKTQAVHDLAMELGTRLNAPRELAGILRTAGEIALSEADQQQGGLFETEEIQKNRIIRQAIDSPRYARGPGVPDEGGVGESSTDEMRPGGDIQVPPTEPGKRGARLPGGAGIPITREEADMLASANVTFRHVLNPSEATGEQGWYLRADAADPNLMTTSYDPGLYPDVASEQPDRLGQRIPDADIAASRQRMREGKKPLPSPYDKFLYSPEQAALVDVIVNERSAQAQLRELDQSRRGVPGPQLDRLIDSPLYQAQLEYYRGQADQRPEQGTGVTPVNPDIRYGLGQPTPGPAVFHSELLRQVQGEDAPKGMASNQAWRSWLAKKQKDGVIKKAELDRIGVEDYLQANKKINAADFAYWVEAHAEPLETRLWEETQEPNWRELAALRGGDVRELWADRMKETGRASLAHVDPLMFDIIPLRDRNDPDSRLPSDMETISAHIHNPNLSMVSLMRYDDGSVELEARLSGMGNRTGFMYAHRLKSRTGDDEGIRSELATIMGDDAAGRLVADQQIRDEYPETPPHTWAEMDAAQLRPDRGAVIDGYLVEPTSDPSNQHHTGLKFKMKPRVYDDYDTADAYVHSLRTIRIGDRDATTVRDAGAYVLGDILIGTEEEMQPLLDREVNAVSNGMTEGQIMQGLQNMWQYDDNQERPPYESFMAPGGNNYRIALVRKPGMGFTRGHFKPDVIVWGLLKDDRTPDGERIVRVEEIQSHLHQVGRQKGYQAGPDSDVQRALSAAETRANELSGEIQNMVGVLGQRHGVVQGVDIPNQIQARDMQKWLEANIRRVEQELIDNDPMEWSLPADEKEWFDWWMQEHHPLGRYHLGMTADLGADYDKFLAETDRPKDAAAFRLRKRLKGLKRNAITDYDEIMHGIRDVDAVRNPQRIVYAQQYLVPYGYVPIGDRLNDTNDQIVQDYKAFVALRDEYLAVGNERARLRQQVQNARTGVPDAPFKEDYPLLLIKQAIREAADRGISQIAWSEGDTISKRYGAMNADGSINDERKVKSNRLWYDSKTVKQLNKYLRKWGVKVQKRDINQGFGRGWYFQMTPEMMEAVRGQSQPYYARGLPAGWGPEVETYSDAADLLSDLGLSKAEAQALHNNGNLRLMDSVDNLPKPGGVPHAADTRGFWWDGKIYLAAGAIPKGEAQNVLMHEVVHGGLKQQASKAQWDMIEAAMQRGLASGDEQYVRAFDSAKRSAAAWRAHQSPTTPGLDVKEAEILREEAVAYLVQEGDRRNPVVRRIITWVKQMLRQAGLGRWAGQMNDQEIIGLAERSLRRMIKEAKARPKPGVPKSNPTPYSPPAYAKPSRAELAARALLEIAEDDDVFHMPASKKKRMDEIAAEVNADIEVQAVGPGDWEITMPDGNVARVTASTARPGAGAEIWVDVSGLSPGGSGGSQVYHIVSTFALNNGARFIGDPGGITDVGVYRRNENMLSSALKYGTTKHLAPGQDQVEPGNLPGFRPLTWRDRDTYGNHLYNITQLMLSSAHNTAQIIPEVANMRYDLRNGKIYEIDSGNEVTNERLQELRAKQEGAPRRPLPAWAQSLQDAGTPVIPSTRTAKAGLSTIRRAVLINTLLREAVGARGFENVRRAVQQLQRGRNGLDKPLRRILYSGFTVRPGDFFSALEDSFRAQGDLATGNERKLKPASWLQEIKSMLSRGTVTQREVDWTGIEGWLRAMPAGTKIGADTVADYIYEQNPRIETSILGGGWTYDQHEQAVADYVNQKVDYASFEIEDDEGSPYYGWTYVVDGANGEIVRDSGGDILYFEDEDSAYGEIEELARLEADAMSDEELALYVGMDYRDPRDFDEQAKYADYAEDEGKNYREFLITWDDPKGNTQYRSSHFSRYPNILVHVRVTDRYTADGKRVLFIEEIQSDWAQDQRKHGILTPEIEAETEALRTELAGINDEVSRLSQELINDANAPGGHGTFGDTLAMQSNYRTGTKEVPAPVVRDIAAQIVARELTGGAVMDYEEAQSVILDEANRRGTDVDEVVRSSSDPWVQKATRFADQRARAHDVQSQISARHTANRYKVERPHPTPQSRHWAMLGMKRMIIEAMDQGYDRVAWTPGAMQDARYGQQEREVLESADELQLAVQYNNAGNPIRAHLFTVNYPSRTPNRQIPLQDIDPDNPASLRVSLEAAVGPSAADALMSADKQTFQGGGTRQDVPTADIEIKPRATAFEEFYDKIVPNAVRKLIKPFGGKIDVHKLYSEPQQMGNQLGDTLGFDLTEPMRDTAYSRGFPMFAKAPPKGTPAFRGWFGDSKVVDAQGQPLRVYHGTRDRFSVFSDEYAPNRHDAGWLGAGHYFTDDPEVASAYATHLKRGEAPNVMPVYLSMQRPFMAPADFKKSLSGQNFRDPVAARRAAEELRDRLIEQGYDGVIWESPTGQKEYVAFDPGQIKSVFDQDIRYSVGPQTASVERRAPDTSSIASYLSKERDLSELPIQRSRPGNRARIEDVATGMDSWMRDHKHTIDVGDFSERAKQQTADRLFDEIAWSAEHDPEAVGWYRDKTEGAMREYARLFPELAANDQAANTAFKSILAVHSNDQTVWKNAETALGAYKMWVDSAPNVEDRRFPEVGSGKRGGDMASSMADLNKLLDDGLSYQELGEFLDQEWTVRELQRMGFPVSKELKDNQVRGAWMFGAKLGSFYGNLNGRFDSLTDDVWFTRTFNRVRGTMAPSNRAQQRKSYDDIKALVLDTDRVADADLLGRKRSAIQNYSPAQMHRYLTMLQRAYAATNYQDKRPLWKRANTAAKLKGHVQGAPRTPRERQHMRDVMMLVAEMRRQQGLPELSMADMQALLWYSEKDFFSEFGAADSGAQRADYQSAAKRAVDAIESGTPYWRP